MGNNKKPINESRRRFLTFGFNKPESKPEMVKMLTAEGKLVVVDKHVLDAAQAGKQVTNHEILQWMENPSKKDSLID